MNLRPNQPHFRSAFRAPWIFTIVAAVWCSTLTTLHGQEPHHATQEPPSRLTLVTYNILADEGKDAALRGAALLDLLEESKADVMALQEVAPWFLKQLEKDRPLSALSRTATVQGEAVGGLFILSRWPILRTSIDLLPSRQERSALIVEIGFGKEKLTVATAHLESPLQAGAWRARQLESVFAKLKDSQNAILLGDFNFGDGEEPETTKLDPQFADPWLKLMPGKPGFTWNMEKSLMARRGSFPNERSRRIDRILFKSTTWQGETIRIIGDEPLSAQDKDSFPSDHFGLKATFVKNGPGKSE